MRPDTPAEGLPSPTSVISIVPVPERALISNVAKAVVVPTSPCISTEPVPEVISRSTEPSIFPLITTLPAVEPVLRVTPPVAIESGSVVASPIVIVPPAPAVPPDVVPPVVLIVVSLSVMA